MNYNQARRLLADGEVEYIRRAAWVEINPDAALSWCVDSSPGRGCICFVSSLDQPYEFGPWGGRQEDLDADDWEAINDDPHSKERQSIVEDALAAGWQWSVTRQNVLADPQDDTLYLWVDPLTREALLSPALIEQLRQQIKRK